MIIIITVKKFAIKRENSKVFILSGKENKQITDKSL
jgi:hypothetical protein